jgi:hypothetical protein
VSPQQKPSAPVSHFVGRPFSGVERRKGG